VELQPLSATVLSGMPNETRAFHNGVLPCKQERPSSTQPRRLQGAEGRQASMVMLDDRDESAVREVQGDD